MVILGIHVQFQSIPGHVRYDFYKQQNLSERFYAKIIQPQMLHGTGVFTYEFTKNSSHSCRANITVPTSLSPTGLQTPVSSEAWKSGVTWFPKPEKGAWENVDVLKPCPQDPCMAYLPRTIKIKPTWVHIPVAWILWWVETEEEKLLFKPTARPSCWACIVGVFL